MMASGGETTHSRPTQQGIGDAAVDYYDIMVIGKTGMGKSTTADKLLVANPYGTAFHDGEHSEPVIDREHMTLDNLSIWLHSDAPDEHLRIKTRLKNLIFFRSLEEPHQEINQFHAGDQAVSGITLNCELISNESTKVRVLDVPGFFGKGDAGALDASAGEKAQCTIDVALGIMRTILQIQAAMNMKFRRILYFLPEQGALKRSSSLLEMELTTMAKYFGKAIFECMVVIATYPAEIYRFAGDKATFTDEDIQKTRKNFDSALSRALPNEKGDLPKPPVVFISLMHSCEKIFENIDKAVVASDQIELEFDPMVCARCGIKAKIINSEKVAVYTDKDEMSTIPYEESTCHPLLVPKYTKVVKFLGGVAHLLTLKQFSGKWPSFHNLDEVCVACRLSPGTHGCKKVDTNFMIKGHEIVVEHTQKTNEPVAFLLDNEQDDAEQDGAIHSEHIISDTGSAQNTISVSASIHDDSAPTYYDDVKG